MLIISKFPLLVIRTFSSVPIPNLILPELVPRKTVSPDTALLTNWEFPVACPNIDLSPSVPSVAFGLNLIWGAVGLLTKIQAVPVFLLTWRISRGVWVDTPTLPLFLIANLYGSWPLPTPDACQTLKSLNWPVCPILHVAVPW